MRYKIRNPLMLNYAILLIKEKKNATLNDCNRYFKAKILYQEC